METEGSIGLREGRRAGVGGGDPDVSPTSSMLCCHELTTNDGKVGLKTFPCEHVGVAD